jgi:hypothetical protein
MFEATDFVLNTKSVPSNIFLKTFQIITNLPMQNSYCDHRNFDNVNWPLHTIHLNWNANLISHLNFNFFLRFSFYTEGIRYSFQAKGILTRIENTPFYSKVTQITGQLEATGHGATLAINELSDLAGFPVYQYPLSVTGALK